MTSSKAQELFERYEQLKAIEQSKNELIEVLSPCLYIRSLPLPDIFH
jgi:hypothetical protein